MPEPISSIFSLAYWSWTFGLQWVLLPVPGCILEIWEHAIQQVLLSEIPPGKYILGGRYQTFQVFTCFVRLEGLENNKQVCFFPPTKTFVCVREIEWDSWPTNNYIAKLIVAPVVFLETRLQENMPWSIIRSWEAKLSLAKIFILIKQRKLKTWRRHRVRNSARRRSSTAKSSALTFTNKVVLKMKLLILKI